MVDSDSEPRVEPAPDPSGDAAAGEADPTAPQPDAPQPDASEADEPAPDDFGPPFTPKTFGGAFVWAKGESYTATVLRVKAGGNVVVSTAGRRDMVILLTGGRAVLEVGLSSGDIDRVELLPASPVSIAADKTYRLLAVTEVEIFTVYAPLA